MKGIDLSLLQRVLDALEEQENALLVWGDTGGFFNLDELLSVIGRVLPDEDAEVVLDQMPRGRYADPGAARQWHACLANPNGGDGPSHAQPAPVDA